MKVNKKNLIISIICSLPLGIALALAIGFSFWPQIPHSLILVFWLIFTSILYRTGSRPIKIFSFSLLILGLIGISMPILTTLAGKINSNPGGAKNIIEYLIFLGFGIYAAVFGIAIIIIGAVIYLIFRKK
jgi:hypothetical protein